MKKFIETLKNCWKVEDLRQRLLITILFTAIYRFGSFVVLPGINPAKLETLQSQTKGGLMSLLDMFSGGAFSNASIFALGIMPYISASIVMQLLAVAVPYFQKMQREGESGRKKINWYTRVLTIAILVFQAPAYLMNLKMQASQALASGISWTFFIIPATIILAAGSMFILWLGERITDKGGEWYLNDYHDWHYCTLTTGFCAGGYLSFYSYFRGRYCDVHCRIAHSLFRCLRINPSGSRHEKGACAICEALSWK